MPTGGLRAFFFILHLFPSVGNGKPKTMPQMPIEIHKMIIVFSDTFCYT